MEQFKDASAGSEGGPCVPRELARGALTLLEELGKGAFGVVWKALLKEEPKKPEGEAAAEPEGEEPPPVDPPPVDESAGEKPMETDDAAADLD